MATYNVLPVRPTTALETDAQVVPQVSERKTEMKRRGEGELAEVTAFFRPGMASYHARDSGGVHGQAPTAMDQKQCQI